MKATGRPARSVALSRSSLELIAMLVIAGALPACSHLGSREYACVPDPREHWTPATARQCILSWQQRRAQARDPARVRAIVVTDSFLTELYVPEARQAMPEGRWVVREPTHPGGGRLKTRSPAPRPATALARIYFTDIESVALRPAPAAWRLLRSVLTAALLGPTPCSHKLCLTVKQGAPVPRELLRDGRRVELGGAWGAGLWRCMLPLWPLLPDGAPPAREVARVGEAIQYMVSRVAWEEAEGQ